MRITFLGTGTSQGVPAIACECDVCQSRDSRDKRLRASVLIEHNDSTIVIDTGPDFRTQMLREGVKKLDAILLTHEHIDHIAGMDDIRPFNFIQKKPMDIYAESRVHDAVKRIYNYVFSAEKYPGIPLMSLIEIDESPFEIGNIHVDPIRVMHYKLPVLGYRINNFCYLTDLNAIREDQFSKLENLEVLVIDALRIRKHLSHFNLEEALENITRIKPKKAFLSHISHMLGKHSDIEAGLPENVFLAYDGLSIEL